MREGVGSHLLLTYDMGKAGKVDFFGYLVSFLSVEFRGQAGICFEISIA